MLRTLGAPQEQQLRNFDCLTDLTWIEWIAVSRAPDIQVESRDSGEASFMIHFRKEVICDAESLFARSA